MVRRLCPNCKKERELQPYEADYLGLSEEERKTQKVYDTVGCQRCNGKGYYGRIGVYEILEVTPTIRNLIAGRASTNTLRDTAISEGMLTLKQAVRRLVLDGTTTLSEMHAISAEDFDAANILSPTGEDII